MLQAIAVIIIVKLTWVTEWQLADWLTSLMTNQPTN